MIQSHYLTTLHRLNDNSNIIKIISGGIIVVFFTLYTHSGMVSGGKLFNTAFGLDYHTGLILVSVIVIAYTFFGGYLAVSLTDFSRCSYANCYDYGANCRNDAIRWC